MVIVKNSFVGPPIIDTKDCILMLLQRSGHQADYLLKQMILSQEYLILGTLAEILSQV